MTCATCGSLPPSTLSQPEITRGKDRLRLLARNGRYYRRSGDLTEFDLHQCPLCGAFFECAHHHYSDPESTMGMGRDESDWYELERLGRKQAIERLKDLQRSSSPDQEAIQEALALLNA